MSATSSMLGMGVTISLRDMFTMGSRRIGAASNALTATMIKNQKAMSMANKQFAIGGGMMLGGGLLVGLLGLIGHKAVKASAQMSVFRMQFNTLVRDGAKAQQLFKDVTAFAANTPFTLPQGFQGAKNLLAFKFATEDVVKELKIAGDWAAIFNVGIERTTEILGRVNSGAYGQAIRALRSLGINPRDLAEYGAPIKNGIMAKNADPQRIIESINKYIQARFGGGMEALMNTIPGRWSNIQDKLILATATMGDAMHRTIFGVVKHIEEALDPDNVRAFGTAFGQGLDLMARALIWILTPLGIFAKSVINLSEAHPGIVKFGVAMIGIAGATLMAAGAFVMLAAVQKLIVLSQASTMWKVWRTNILAFLPGLGWAALAVFALVAAFKSGDKTVMQTLKLWYDNLSSIVGGLVELFSSINNGIGTMSMGTAKKLKSAGLLDMVISIFMAGYRIYQIVAGAFQSFSVVMTGVGWVLGRIVWVVDILITGVSTLAGWLGLAGRQAPTNAFKVLGNVLGIVVAWMLLFSVYTKIAMGWTFISTVLIPAMSAAYLTLTTSLKGGALWMGIAKVATWAFNAALWANPIVWIVGLVILLIVAIVLLVVHFDKIKAKMKEMPDWAMIAFGPTTMGLMLVIKYWDKLARIMTAATSLGKMVWKDMVDSMMSVTLQLVTAVSKLFRGLFKFIPNWALPAELKVMKALSDDKTRAAGVEAYKKAWSPLTSKDETNGWIGKNLDALGAELETMATSMQLLQANANRPLTVPVYIDGRKVAQAVAKHENNEHDSGR